ncbi:MAG: Isopentenyl-diphosphate Delta-isomerase [candidate division WS6 bacterium OLB20]|uniref:Isopentenyl-diphosphate Delta-isomerase n=1 Tax=candidate division WS6 bacterium OLB20 TaxID=1617426 RepID=A0A136LZ29_9BACT|nr:MAG: Isopentenyl-diphosphate Delta-isomerase [candidate division WS6 bacterium OLB20]
MEVFDLVDSEGNIIGETTRDEAHSDPSLIHPVVHSWIFNRKGQVLLQQRSLQKKIHPGMWDMSVGGHLSKGDTAKDGLRRELAEELNITDYSAELIRTYVRGKEYETEFIYLYHVSLVDDNQQFTMQTEEVEQVRWFDLAEVYVALRDSTMELTPSIAEQLPQVMQYLIAKAVS